MPASGPPRPAGGVEASEWGTAAASHTVPIVTAARPVPTSTERIKAHVDDHVGWLVLNQPDKHNALSGDMFRALGEVLTEWAGDDDVRVVVVRGEGERAFASGADIGDLGGGISGPSSSGQRGTTLAIAKPVIAMIHGYCIGGGLMVAMEADLRIASEDATFGIPAARLGAGYPLDSVQRLVALCGPAHASSILFTGDRLNAEVALRIGLVNEVVPKGALEHRVQALAAQISDHAPLSMMASKASIAASIGLAGSTEAAARELIAACWDSADFAEGKASFAEKRTPRFTGR